MFNALGICYFPHHNYIDHIVPLCQILNVPLLVSDEHVEQLIRSYYPEMELIYEPDIHREWKKILDGYEILIYTEFYRRYHGAFEFFDFAYSRNMRSIFCSHGNSDKGQRDFWMERFTDEDITLVYGQKMIDFLKSKGAWERLKCPLVSGNFRHAYYLTHQRFFDSIVEAELFPSWRKKDQKKNLLYIPTWHKRFSSMCYEWDESSFFMAYPFLFNHIPSDFRLFVKLHPNLSICHQEEIQSIKQTFRDRENIHFIEDCPLIYPLLAKMDAYIGDLSSVGYDFITFNRPMFFLNSEARDSKRDPGLFLYRCGIEIRPDEFPQIYTIIDAHLDDPLDLKNRRKEIYDYTFGAEISLKELKERVVQAC